ncbi:MAG: hypothetical protein WBI57_17085 [Desulfobacterales bacterium]
MSNNTDKINLAIMENELSATEWALNSLAWELYWWVNAFQMMFFKHEPVPIPALTFGKARVNTLGHYRVGLNDFAVREQINLNKIHLHRPLWNILATLLHEMVHSWEYAYIEPEKRTKSWYHSNAFREKMDSFGIECASNGSHIGINNKGQFAYLLRQHAVTFDNIPDFKMFKGAVKIFPIDGKPKIKGRSKLSKWTCPCGQNARVGKAEFHASCDLCNERFAFAG